MTLRSVSASSVSAPLFGRSFVALRSPLDQVRLLVFLLLLAGAGFQVATIPRVVGAAAIQNTDITLSAFAVCWWIGGALMQAFAAIKRYDETGMRLQFQAASVLKEIRAYSNGTGSYELIPDHTQIWKYFVRRMDAIVEGDVPDGPLARGGPRPPEPTEFVITQR